MPFPVPMRFPNIPPFMAMTYDAFGASHIMWGSDFPPVAGREGDKEWIFGKTALSLFKFAR